MPRILVVDDAEFMRLRLSKLLASHGYEVIEAADGQQAVERYRALRPDLVLMDITMPVMDGIAAVKGIKQIDTSATIIMCSALGQQSMVIEAVKAGARDFVVKPFEPEKILAVIKKHVG